MEVKIGVIGTGSIGRDHIRRIAGAGGCASVVAVSDVDVAVAREVGARYGAGLFERGEDLIASREVDAVLVTSTDTTHEQYVLAAIERGKRVFCEKPLAPGPDGARRIVNAEMAAGRRLVQVGYMRRFDAGYLELKDAVQSRRLGAPLMVHCAHRNRSAGEGYTTSMAIENSAVHEFDILRWLLEEDYVSARVVLPRKTRHSHPRLHDPQIILLETRSGVAIDIEVFVNCRYGYDIRCEVCCEDGTISLPQPSSAVTCTDGARSVPVFADWIGRFEAAYDAEIRQWIRAVAEGAVAGPSAWDGYVATFTAACCSKARDSAAAVPIAVEARPAFYGA